MFRCLARTDLEAVALRKPGQSIVPQILVQVGTDFIGVSTGQMPDFHKVCIICNHLLVIWDAIEHAGKQVIIHCPEHPCLSYHRHFERIRQRRLRYAFYAFVATHDAHITLAPHRCSELWLSRSNVQTGVYS